MSQWLANRSTLTTELEERPYDSEKYLQRGLCHENLGYLDLAASDAYRALLLTDEVLDEEGEYHDQAVEALEVGAKREDEFGGSGWARDGMKGRGSFAKGYAKDGMNGDDRSCEGREKSEDEEEPWYYTVARNDARQSYEILARTLAECGDLKSAFDFVVRGLIAFPGSKGLQALKEQILERHCHGQLEENPSSEQSGFNPREYLPENGSARRKIYPWNNHEPDRFSEENLSFINAEIKKSAPKCEVRVVELPLLASGNSVLKSSTTIKQLGVFTTSSISPHETVLLEPSIFTSSTRLHEPFCDACSSSLPPFSPDQPLPACQNCEDTVFCSEACHDHAQSLYHRAICGIPDFDVIAKDPSPFAATNCLYTLLIARTIAMAETQNLHPLDLPQIKFLWGDFTSAEAPLARNLPFSFENNIQQPLHLLASLSLDIFAPSTLSRYDTWVINTLLSKFRCVANAKMNERTGRPEVAGVHWLWSLANHSCAPNVRWEWEKGGMGFVARGGEEVVRWGERRSEVSEWRWKGGIAEGEEVLNHYCDVELDVRQRREWAVGALGGVCLCERCIWEEEEEKRKEVYGVEKNQVEG